MYEVEDQKKQHYALKKIIVSETDQLEHARHEIEIMKAIPEHENVVRIVASAETPFSDPKRKDLTQVLILMELCARGTVLDYMNENAESLPQEKVLQIFGSICAAVKHLHELTPSIIHRDLKLENVLLAADDTYKLCDFGSATTQIVNPAGKNEQMQAQEDIEKNTTLAFRAPEQVDLHSGKLISERVDIWALGTLLYQLMFRKTPFNGASNLEILNGKCEIPDHSPYSEDLHNLIRWMLTKDPDERPAINAVLDRISKLSGKKLSATLPSEEKSGDEALSKEEPGEKSSELGGRSSGAEEKSSEVASEQEDSSQSSKSDSKPENDQKESKSEASETSDRPTSNSSEPSSESSSDEEAEDGAKSHVKPDGNERLSDNEKANERRDDPSTGSVESASSDLSDTETEE